MAAESAGSGIGNSRRIACVWLPRFALTIATSLDPTSLPPQTNDERRTTNGAVGDSSSVLRPSALFRPGTRWQELLECSPDLEAVGIRPGLPLKEAQSRFPNATFLPCDEATLDTVARAFQTIVEALDSFSPAVEPAPRAALGDGRALAYLDVAGLTPLYGPESHLAARLATAAETALYSLLCQSPELPQQLQQPQHPQHAPLTGNASGMALHPLSIAMERGGAQRRGEVVPPVPRRASVAQAPASPDGKPGTTGGGFAESTQHSALSTQHLPVRVGIAAGKFTAWVAASLAGHFSAAEPVQVVPPGEEATFLAPLPLETLPLPLRDRQALHRLGVHTLGQFAHLPANAVQHRYGAAGRHAHLLAQGIDDDPLRPRRPQPTAAVEIEFDWEESELDRLTFALKLLADQLAARLTSLSASPEPEAEDPHYHPIEDDAVDSPLSLEGRGGQGVRALSTDTLRLTWRLATGEERPILLRLAEPASSAAAFMEHLRWHAEGLDRFLIAKNNVRNNTPSDLALIDNCEKSLTYQPLEQRIAVRGIRLEAMGIQTPGGTQLKLLASPLQTGAAAGSAASHLDPVTRATQARRAIARLQARWADAPSSIPPVVWQPALTTSRLPEHAFQPIPPHLGLQVEDANLTADLFPKGKGSTAAANLPASGNHPLPFREGGRGVRSDSYSPLLSHVPFWLVDPPEPTLLLNPRRKGGRALLRLGAGRNRRTQRELRVLHYGGPWKLVDPTLLTAAEPLVRDYYQVEAEDGRAYLIFWHRPSDSWFLQGIFD